jgi:hypothetical protein
VITGAIAAVLVTATPIATAQAGDSSLGEMAGNINQLAAPARRTELRLDAGGVALLPRRGSRFDVALEIAPRPDYWYSIGVGTASTATTTQVITVGPDGSETTTTVSSTNSDVSLSARIFKPARALALAGGPLNAIVRARTGPPLSAAEIEVQRAGSKLFCLSARGNRAGASGAR